MQLIPLGTQIPIPTHCLYPKKKRPILPNHQKTNVYKITTKLGDGGFGEVYLAECITPEAKPQRLAIKVFCLLTKEKGDKKGEKIRKITKASQDLNRKERHHEIEMAYPHFKHVWGFNLIMPEKMMTLYCMTMEFIPGTVLSPLNNRLAFGASVILSAQLCDQLFRLHSSGWIHHDIAERNVLNVMWRRSYESTEYCPYRARLIDYGLALKNELFGTDNPDGLFLRSPRDRLGTPLGLAPEEGVENAYIGTKTDVYALGLLFTQLFRFYSAINRRRELKNNIIEGNKASLAAFLSFSFSEYPNYVADLPFEELPLNPFNLVLKFIRKILPEQHFTEATFDHPEELFASYLTRPSTLDCLQFFIWMNQICIYLKEKNPIYEEELMIAQVKCRLLVENAWPFFKTVDFSKQPQFCSYIIDFPIKNDLDVREANQQLLFIPDVIPKQVVEHLQKNNLPVAVYEEAILAKKLLPELVTKLFRNSTSMIYLRDILKRLSLNIDLQQKILQETPHKINYLFNFLLSVKNTAINTWLQHYFSLQPEQRPGFGFAHLSQDNLYELYSLMFSEKTMLLCILGRSQLTPLREAIQASILSQVIQYEKNIVELCIKHGDQHRRGWSLGYTVGEKKAAVQIFQAYFSRFFTVESPEQTFRKELEPVASALKQGELGKMVNPILAKLTKWHHHFSQPAWKKPAVPQQSEDNSKLVPQ